MNYERATGLLRQWAELGGADIPAAIRNPCDWAPVQQVVGAARRLLIFDQMKLEALLEKSNSRLEPLADPFEVDLGVHLWLSGKREEVYSDWLEWIVRQVQKPELVFRLFQVQPPADLAEWPNLPPEVIQREAPVPKGREGKSGRLDLVVRYKGRALLVVEVKTTVSEPGEKEKGYFVWMKEEPEPSKFPVFLAIDSQDVIPGDFQILRWRDVCQVLRRLVPEVQKEKGVIAGA